MSKVIQITNTATATITETWRYEVPDDWESGEDNENALDVLSSGGDDDMIRYLCNWDGPTDDERDREITEVVTLVGPYFTGPATPTAGGSDKD